MGEDGNLSQKNKICKLDIVTQSIMITFAKSAIYAPATAHVFLQQS